MRIRSLKLCLAMLLAVPMLSGCWDRLEIEDRAVVLGISIDEAEPQEEKEDEVNHAPGIFPATQTGMINIGVQIALPGKIPLGPGEGGGGTGGPAQTVWVLNVTGHSIDDAIMNLQQQVSGRLFFGHLRIIVVSEAIAHKGLQDLNDYFRRNPEVRRMAWMVISKGNALDIMRAKPQLERVPTLYLLSTMDNAVKMGKFPVNYVGMFWSNTSKKGQEAYLPYIELKKEQNIEVKGLAYFRNSSMVGSTEPYEIGAFMAIKGMNPAGYRGFVQLGDPSKLIMIYPTSRDAKVRVRIQNGLPHFTVSINMEINVEEKVSESFVINHSANLKEITNILNKEVRLNAERLIEKTQKEGTDIFGFGEQVRGRLPGYWNRNVKSKEGWQEMYRRVTVDFVVNTHARRIGMKAK